MEQVVINLVHNAEDALTGLNDKRIALIIEKAPAGAVIQVGDNGRGIDPMIRDQLYVPFFTTKAGGAGIGLSLVRQIALAHGGHVEIKDQVPHGANFWVHVPVGQAVPTASS